MSNTIDLVKTALQKAATDHPASGGFTYLAETLRQAGVTNNIWHLPSCQSLYLTKDGAVAHIGEPLAPGMIDIPKFNREALIAAVKADQAGKTSFSEFLQATWAAGVVRYEVNFGARRVTYYGCRGDEYEEDYSKVMLKLKE